MTFLFETICGPRILFEALKFGNSFFFQIVQMTLDGKMTKTKIVDLDYFIRNHL